MARQLTAPYCWPPSIPTQATATSAGTRRSPAGHQNPAPHRWSAAWRDVVMFEGLPHSPSIRDGVRPPSGAAGRRTSEAPPGRPPEVAAGRRRRRVGRRQARHGRTRAVVAETRVSACRRVAAGRRAVRAERRATRRGACAPVPPSYGDTTSSSYTAVSHPHLVPRLLHRTNGVSSTGARRAVHRPLPRGDEGRSRHVLSVLSLGRLAGRRLPQHRRRLRHPPPPGLPAVRPPLQHRRDRQPHRGQALRRHRAVQPGKIVSGVRKACQGRPGRGGPAGPARASASRSRSAPPAPPRSRRTRSGWRSSRRCASSTRSPTSASRASTRRSSRWRTSSRPSRCCGPSVSPPGSSPAAASAPEPPPAALPGKVAPPVAPTVVRGHAPQGRIVIRTVLYLVSPAPPHHRPATSEGSTNDRDRLRCRGTQDPRRRAQAAAQGPDR